MRASSTVRRRIHGNESATVCCELKLWRPNLGPWKTGTKVWSLSPPSRNRPPGWKRLRSTWQRCKASWSAPVQADGWRWAGCCASFVRRRLAAGAACRTRRTLWSQGLVLSHRVAFCFTVLPWLIACVRNSYPPAASLPVGCFPIRLPFSQAYDLASCGLCRGGRCRSVQEYVAGPVLAGLTNSGAHQPITPSTLVPLLILILVSRSPLPLPVSSIAHPQRPQRLGQHCGVRVRRVYPSAPQAFTLPPPPPRPRARLFSLRRVRAHLCAGLSQGRAVRARASRRRRWQ